MADVIEHTHSAPASLFKTDNQSDLHFKLPRSGVGGAFLMLVKTIVGVGLFVLPWAFRVMGIGSAMIAMAVVAVLTYYTNSVLIRVRDVIVRDTLKRDLTYVSLAEHCFGTRMGYVVYFLVVFTTIGSNGAYLVFIGKVLHSLAPTLSVQAWAGITALAVTPFCLARSTAFLAYTSILGNIGVVLVVAVVFARGAQVATFLPAAEYASFNTPAFMQGFGVIGFVFACSTAVLTIEKSMSDRRRFGAAMQLALWLVFFLCAAFGIVNYLYFGASVCSIVVLNLGSGALSAVAKIAIVVDLAFTYPMSIAPAREIIEKSILSNDSSFLRVKQTCIRIALIGITFALCYFPQMDIIVNIVGGWSVSALAFILPCCMLMQLRRLHLRAYDKQSKWLQQHADGLKPSPASPHGAVTRRDSHALGQPEHTSHSLLPHEPTPTDAISPRGSAHDPRHVKLIVDSSVMPRPTSSINLNALTLATTSPRAHSVTPVHTLLAAGVHHPIAFDPWRGDSHGTSGTPAASVASPLATEQSPDSTSAAAAAGVHPAIIAALAGQHSATDSVYAGGSVLASLGRLTAASPRVASKAMPMWFPLWTDPHAAATPAATASHKTYDAATAVSHPELATALMGRRPSTPKPQAAHDSHGRNTPHSAIHESSHATRVDIVVHGHAIHRPRIGTAFDVVSTSGSAPHAASAPPVASVALAPVSQPARVHQLSMVAEADEELITTPMVSAQPAPPTADAAGGGDGGSAAVMKTAPPASVDEHGVASASQPSVAVVPNGSADGGHVPAPSSVYDGNGSAASAAAAVSSPPAVKGEEAHAHHHHHGRHRSSFLQVFGRHHRHKQALLLLGVGSAVENVLLSLVALFGVAVLILTTVQSIQDAVSSVAEPAVCAAG